MEEALVIFACLNSTGCSQTSKLYYNTHPEVQEMVHNSEKIVKKYIGPIVIETAGPILVFVAGGTGTVRLNKYFNLQINKTNVIFGFGKNF